MRCTASENWIVSITLAMAGLFVVSPPELTATVLTKLPGVLSANTMETTPIVWQGQQFLFESHRDTVVSPSGTYLGLKNLTTGVELSTFGSGYSLGCAFVDGNQINVFASQLTTNDWFTDIYRFTSTDGVNWSAPTLAVARSGEHLLNSSVTRDSQGYLMAYESDNPVGFCYKFARSTDLATWTKVDVPAFAGPNGNQYSACPTIRYSGGYYYTLYLAEASVAGGQSGWATQIARSKDLLAWEYSDKNPVLTPGEGEGVNNSDADLFEFDGKTYVYYATGDQTTWLELKRAMYDGPMSEFLGGYFPPAHSPEPGTMVLLGMGALSLLAHGLRKRGRLAIRQQGKPVEISAKVEYALHGS